VGSIPIQLSTQRTKGEISLIRDRIRIVRAEVFNIAAISCSIHSSFAISHHLTLSHLVNDDFGSTAFQKNEVLSDPSMPEHYRVQLARSLQRDLFVWVNISSKTSNLLSLFRKLS
jgi:hypothetical protein